MLRDFPAALASCAEGLTLDPEDGELLFRKAVVHGSNGESGEAEHCWRRILTLSRPRKFASLDEGIFGQMTRRNLAALAEERGYGGGPAAVAGHPRRLPGRQRGPEAFARCRSDTPVGQSLRERFALM